MKVTEQNIIDLEQSISVLNRQKEKLVFDKKEAELQNSFLNNKVRSGGRLHDVKYKNICEQQNKIKGSVLKIERAIGEVNTEITKKSNLIQQLRFEFKKQKNIDTKEQLTIMRDYYINFASDKTRVSSMRAMGAEFAEKIERIIKQL